MGELNCHNILPHIEKYGCSTFVETGTGIGTGLEYAARFPFKKLYTIEYMRELHTKNLEKFSGYKNHQGHFPQKIHLLFGSSIERLPEILKEEVDTPSIFFWLDAHFPGADFQLGKYEDQYNFDIKFPLKAELDIIKQHRAGKKDVFVIDDLRIYEFGDYELGNIDNPAIFLGTGIDFIKQMFEETHIITKDMRQQGFVIMEPKT